MMTDKKYGKILVTGANGFIGSKVLSKLTESEFEALGVTRDKDPQGNFVFNDFERTGLGDLIDGVETIVHCAAITQSRNLDSERSFSKLNDTNVRAVEILAQQAKSKGVKRIIFLSSIKVLGESSPIGSRFSATTTPAPQDAYGRSKHAAELALKKELSGSSTDFVIIRPPMVYGPGVKGNFKAFMNLAERNLPLPLSSVKNMRSMVALDNLVDLILTCVTHPTHLNETFLVSDDYDVSTPELLNSLTLSFGKKPRLFPFPVSIMKLAAMAVGKTHITTRLFESLQVDISHTKRILRWTPPVKFADAIDTCANFELRARGDLKK